MEILDNYLLENIDANEERERKTVIDTLALCQANLNESQKYLDQLALIRSGLTKSIQYSHLLARFLIKRHNKVVSKSKNN